MADRDAPKLKADSDSSSCLLLWISIKYLYVPIVYIDNAHERRIVKLLYLC